MGIQKKLIELIEKDSSILSPCDFARKAGIAKQTVNLIVRGKINRPSYKTLEKIGIYFNCSVGSLLGIQQGHSHEQALRYLLELKGKNAHQLSKAAKIDPSIVYSILSGRAQMLKDSSMMRICKALKVNPEIFKKRAW